MPLGTSPINRHGREPMAASEHLHPESPGWKLRFVQMERTVFKVAAIVNDA
jgi:hypothetical protein